VNQRVPAGDSTWRAVSWSWSPLEWAWVPATGGYRSRLGGPSRAVSIRIDTQHAPAADRFDLWREVTQYGHDSALPDRTLAGRFAATALGFFAHHRRLTLYQCEPVIAVRSHRQSRDYGEDLNLGFVMDGERLAETETDGASRTGPAEFFFDDSARRLEATYETRHRTAWLTLKRSEVSGIFQGEPPAPSVLLGILKSSRLAPVLQAQFAAVARHGSFFTDAEGDAAMSAMTSLALAALASGRDEAALEARTAAPALVIAARRHIESHLGAPGLNVDDLVCALGCSRRALYRAFAAAGGGVAETIRDLRLERLRQLLESEPVSVTEAAERCGFSDPRTLQRQFKARFGLSARDFQARARSL
jgi:AraC-like DNA-binding protein